MIERAAEKSRHDQQYATRRDLRAHQHLSRGRRTMALTETGERFLAQEWRKGLDAGREIESVLRSATVALLMGDIGEASRFLSESITKRTPL